MLKKLIVLSLLFLISCENQVEQPLDKGQEPIFVEEPSGKIRVLVAVTPSTSNNVNSVIQQSITAMNTILTNSNIDIIGGIELAGIINVSYDDNNIEVLLNQFRNDGNSANSFMESNYADVGIIITGTSGDPFGRRGRAFKVKATAKEDSYAVVTEKFRF